MVFLILISPYALVLNFPTTSHLKFLITRVMQSSSHSNYSVVSEERVLVLISSQAKQIFPSSVTRPSDSRCSAMRAFKKCILRKWYSDKSSWAVVVVW